MSSAPAFVYSNAKAKARKVRTRQATMRGCIHFYTEDGRGKTTAALGSGDYDVIVLDEANVAVQVGLFPVSALIEIMEDKPDEMEIVITGRGANEMVIQRANPVTEMKEIKHYYGRGVVARTKIAK